MFVLDKSELLYLVINSLPYIFNVDSELEFPSILERNQYFHVILVVYVLLKFLYFCQGKRTNLKPQVHNVQFVISNDESDLLILAIYRFVIDAFRLVKNDGFPVDDFSLVESNLLEAGKFIDAFISEHNR